MPEEKNPEPETLKQIGIHYQRSRHYRTIHADGAQIGMTPRGQVQFTLFSDQKPMPEFVLHQITQGTLGPPLEQVVKDGAIREVEVNVIMDVESATSFMSVLQTTLNQIENLKKVPAEQGNQNIGK
jgi:hypothetical protein